MRRQTILLAAALGVAMPATAAISQNRNAVSASRHPSSPTGRDRLILLLAEARQASSSIASADETTTFGLAPREVAPEAADLAPQIEVEVKPFAPMAEHGARFAAPDMTGYAPHIGLAPVYAFEEPQIGRVSLNVGPVATTSYRDGDARLAPRADAEIYGTDVSGVAVGFSFKLN